jgi:acyl-CoA synthetase (AMP-forming)/AMP-acid ligase II
VDLARNLIGRINVGDTLIASMKTLLDGYKVPKSVIVTGQLPKTSTGKIQKNVVRSEHAQHYQARPYQAGHDADPEHGS